MRGRILVWPLLALLALGLFAQAQRWRSRLLASTLVHQVQMISLSVAGSNPGALDRLLPYNLAALRRAAEADPAAVEVPLSRGSLYLLLQRAPDAAGEYRRAAALEPHPEIYLHLGDALLAAGRFEDARRNYRLAVLLDPWLRTSVPGGAL
jgi:tetratricopeptide (TPR) repeat protein